MALRRASHSSALGALVYPYCRRTRYNNSTDVPWDVMSCKHFPHCWSFLSAICWSPMDVPHKMPVMRCFDIFFDVSLKCSQTNSRTVVISDAMTFMWRYHRSTLCMTQTSTTFPWCAINAPAAFDWCTMNAPAVFTWYPNHFVLSLPTVATVLSNKCTQ